MRVLVTGGAGFIGSHLVEALLAQGDEVIVVDNASTGDFTNLDGVSGHAGLVLHHGSVCDPVLMDELAAQTEQIIHLAAAVGVEHILANQVSSIVTNLRGTEVVLQVAAAHGMQPVFLASSSEVYGKGGKVPFAEDDDCVIGATSLHRWSYACGKAMDEFLALAYHRERGLPVRIGRFFNITGPRQSPHYGMVVPKFCTAALQDDCLQVHGDGQQTRCFLHVADCVRAVLALIDAEQAVGEVVNIGGEEEVAIGDLATRICQQAGGGRVVRQSYQEAFPGGGFEDLRRRVPTTAKLRRLVDWQERRDLTAIIADCLTTCRSTMDRTV